MHINTTYSYVGAKAAIEENLPFVWHLREFLEEDQNNTLWDRDEGNKLINKANRIIAISDSIFKKYESIFDNGKLVRIFNGIDATKFYKPHKTIFNEDIIKFIMVGGFEYYKGQIEFAKACAELYTSGFHDFDVSFIGTGRGDVKSEGTHIEWKSDEKNPRYKLEKKTTGGGGKKKKKVKKTVRVKVESFFDFFEDDDEEPEEDDEELKGNHYIIKIL